MVSTEYFIVFGKNGFVYYEIGDAPAYLNNLIGKIDLKSVYNTKIIQDKFVEYKIQGMLIFLCISNKKNNLEKFIKDYYTIYPNRLYNDNLNNISASKIRNVSQTLFYKSFSLFTGKIHFKELKAKIIDHFIRMNIEIKYANILYDNIIQEFLDDKTQWINENDFRSKSKIVLSKLLPSLNHVNLINKIKETNKEGKPFVFCFVGVNGVGKSTSVAKMTKWLLEHKLSVFIAACDTFRAGAIEQLKTYVDQFITSGYNVGFYKSGYNKDDAIVAKTAIAKAHENNYDVVLIDTAGRMHNNGMLMSSLSKIIRMNTPDHIVYVGEALTGNDSLNFVEEFNKYISNAQSGRIIDSIILTKIDTVDKKLGQIFNLTFKAQAPILFLGCGQTNSDLIEVDPDKILDLLLN
ncbi:signal recognition particle receptor alpha subunit [Enterocytozoon bieneusi H348]|nr:signal recognition particle receptor alpha subunit [Enterocytozoon bieneusi H348]|eukprot:XP_002650024.1 signal recognition particle receptor alpha subunit [Enterocytozoon bieneusi H348]